jgi:hypothetical protein
MILCQISEYAIYCSVEPKCIFHISPVKNQIPADSRSMEITASHIRFLIPYVVVNENYAKVETTLISIHSANCDGEYYQLCQTGDNTSLTAFWDFQIVPICWSYIDFPSRSTKCILVSAWISVNGSPSTTKTSASLPTSSVPS